MPKFPREGNTSRVSKITCSPLLMFLRRGHWRHWRADTSHAVRLVPVTKASPCHQGQLRSLAVHTSLQCQIKVVIME